MKIPMHIKPQDQSADAKLERYALANRMMHYNPKGFRLVGNKGGVTKPKRRNWLERLGRDVASS